MNNFDLLFFDVFRELTVLSASCKNQSNEVIAHSGRLGALSTPEARVSHSPTSHNPSVVYSGPQETLFEFYDVHEWMEALE